METVKKYFGAICVIGLAFFVIFRWGRIGFGFYDMSFFIDTAYRILHGQKMYTDIGLMSHGPATYYLQALFFKIFGVSLQSCLAHAAFMNALSAGILYFYFWKRLPPLWTMVLGVFSAIWFYAMVAWPWVERISYLAGLIAFLLWDQLGENEEGVFKKIFLIGALAALPLWDKQNIAFALAAANGLVCLVFAFRQSSIRPLIWFCLGYLVVAGGLFLFFWINGWEPSIYEYFQRSASLSRFSNLLILPSSLLYWPFLICTGMAIFALQVFFKDDDPQNQWKGLLVAALLLLQIFNAPLSSAHNINDLALLPLAFGLFLSIKRKAVSLGRQPLVIAAVVFFLFFGYHTAKQRDLWTFAFPNPQLGAMKHPFFKNWQVQQPQGKEVDEALLWLDGQLKKDETFWVFPSMVFMYAALDRVSNSPYLSWEARLITDPNIRGHDERRTLNWFAKTPPTWIVLQKKLPHPGDNAHNGDYLLNALPLLKSHIENHYESVHTMEGFEFFKLKRKEENL